MSSLEERPPCPRCEQGEGLLTAAKAGELAEDLYLPPALRADFPVYEERLESCAACAALREDVICAYCGCIVQLRARPKAGYCPHPAGDRWKGAGFPAVIPNLKRGFNPPESVAAL